MERTELAEDIHARLERLREHAKTLSPAANRRLAAQLKEIRHGMERAAASRNVPAAKPSGNGHQRDQARTSPAPHAPRVQRERARAGGGSTGPASWGDES
jgi:hypothetical protein